MLEGTRSGLRALGHLLDLAAADRPRPPATVDVVRRDRWVDAARGRAALDRRRRSRMLRDYGIPTVEVAAAAATRDEAVAAARELGWPVVLKTDEGVAHKWDVGGVHLGLRDDEAVLAAYDDLAARLGPRVLVSSSAAAGTELVLGITHDPMLGPLVVLGAGGVLVEVLRDRVVALPPLDLARAQRLVDRLACRPLLDGRARRPGCRPDRCVVVGERPGQLAVELGDRVAALDVNPVIAGPDGAVAVDVLVVPRS